MKNKNTKEIKETKGGLFSLQKLSNLNFEKTPNIGNGFVIKTNKVCAIDNAEEFFDDIENAPFHPTQGDEELILPDIARSLQYHHDGLDRQLIDQNALLITLQETLKNEVDDLKRILLTPHGHINENNDNHRDMIKSSYEEMNNKLMEILKQLKSDINIRNYFESSLDTSEKKTYFFLQNLIRLLTHGPSIIAEEIIDEIIFEKNKKIKNKSPQNRSDDNNLFSTTLENIFQELKEIKSFINEKIMPTVSYEKNRKNTAENIFDTALKQICHVSVAPIVLEHLSMTRKAEMDLDHCVEKINHIYSTFASRTSKFCSTMREEVGCFVEDIAVDLVCSNVPPGRKRDRVLQALTGERRGEEKRRMKCREGKSREGKRRDGRGGISRKVL
jgi:2-hydroxy-3-keto-5-methylthiopentenyl-1-phosphate phosphatase